MYASNSETYTKNTINTDTETISTEQLSSDVYPYRCQGSCIPTATAVQQWLAQRFIKNVKLSQVD